MKVYFRACDYYINRRGIISDFLNGRYPIEGETLWVRDGVLDTTHIWEQLEFHDECDDVVYELDLPHSLAELARTDWPMRTR